MKKFIFLTLLLLSFFSQTFAQNGAILIRINVFNNERLQSLFLSDLDLEQVGSAEKIFELTITKNVDQGFPTCYLSMMIAKDGKPLMLAKSEKFSIPADFTSATTDNIELINNRFYIGENLVHMNHGELADDVGNIQKEILASGKVPVGVYKMEITISTDPQGSQSIGQGEKIILQATNPSYVQLIAPGQQVGAAQSANIYTEFPVFQWNGNGDEYQVVVFERKRMLSSLDDILNSRPNWESERTSALSLQYPQGNQTIPLEFGKTYFWMVRMFIQSSSGEEKVNSEVWYFNLVDPANRGNAQAQVSKNEILSFLKELLGDRGATLSRQLAGYELKTIRFNGEPIDIQTLYRRLNRYRGKNINIFDFFISGDNSGE